MVWVLLRPTRTRQVKALWDGTYVFSSLSEKIRKSNCLQMSLQRQLFLLSHLKTPCLSVGPAEVWTRNFPLSRLAFSQLSLPGCRKKIYSGIESTLKVSRRMEDPSLYECCVGDRFGEVVESKREHKNASHWQTLNTFSTIVTLYILEIFPQRCFPKQSWESNSYATANLFHLQLSPAWGKGLSTKFGWQFDLRLVF